MNLYEHLEISPEVDLETIKQAIARQSAVWSRRVSTSASLRTKHEAENMMEVLADARHHLLDESRRREYDASLVKSGGLLADDVAEALPAPSLKPGVDQTFQASQQPSSHEQVSEKSCPYCGESIKAQAIKCRHCGEFLEGSGSRPATSPPAQPLSSPQPRQEPDPVVAVSAPAPQGASGAGVVLAIVVIGVVGLVIGAMMSRSPSSASSTETVTASAVEPAQTYETPTPPPLPPLTEEEVDGLVRNWQVIKREALLNLDATRLEEVLTDKALKDMRGAIEWESDPAHQERYHGIDLVSLRVNSFDQPTDEAGSVSVTIEEQKEFELRGKCKITRSQYRAVYNLQRDYNGWRIADIPQDQIETYSKNQTACSVHR